jgi:hypothetical protein
MIIAVGAFALPVKPVVWAAARECARWAVESLDPVQGQEQGIAAAQDVLAGSNLRRGDPTINISYINRANGLTEWVRGTEVTCTVTYPIDTSGFTVTGFFGSPSALSLSSSVTLSVEPLKSKWQPR